MARARAGEARRPSRQQEAVRGVLQKRRAAGEPARPPGQHPSSVAVVQKPGVKGRRQAKSRAGKITAERPMAGPPPALNAGTSDGQQTGTGGTVQPPKEGSRGEL